MHSRAFNLLLAFFCHELLVLAYYFQYVKGLNPCPLCILQRVVVVALMVWFLFLAITNVKKGGVLNRLINGLASLTALAGVIVAGRQVWLQHLPADEVPACGPSLEYMMDMFTGSELLNELFRGSGECAKVDWTLFGFSMPEYTLAFFSVTLLFTAWRAWQK
jgi:disulfide bond formation protein DsbB